MTASSVSFRIARHTEDLAQTIHALSQRLVQLEQRLSSLEAQFQQAAEEAPPADQLASLAHVDQLLRDCRELLAVEAEPGPVPLSGVSVAREDDKVVASDPLEEPEPFAGLKQAA